MDAAGTHVSNFSSVVFCEGALDGESVGLSIGHYLIGNEGCGGCALGCEPCRSVWEGEDSTFSGRKTTVREEVGGTRQRITGSAYIVRSRILRRKGEGTQIVEQDIVGKAETGTDRGLVVGSPVDSDARSKALVGRLRLGEGDEAWNRGGSV